MQPYPPEVEQQMQRFYQLLSEKERRRYAAVEALKLGRDGLSYQVVVNLVDKVYQTG